MPIIQKKQIQSLEIEIVPEETQAKILLVKQQQEMNMALEIKITINLKVNL